MRAAVHSFAVRYRIARGTPLSPRTPCSCGCGRTVSALDRVCCYTPKGETEARVYFEARCFFDDVNKRGMSR
jgi:hypothetical protein